jgi:uncharacterized protein with GYD domain
MNVCLCCAAFASSFEAYTPVGINDIVAIVDVDDDDAYVRVLECVRVCFVCLT